MNFLWAMASSSQTVKFPEGSPNWALAFPRVRAIGSTLDDQVEEANRHHTQDAILGTMGFALTTRAKPNNNWISQNMNENIDWYRTTVVNSGITLDNHGVSIMYYNKPSPIIRCFIIGRTRLSNDVRWTQKKLLNGMIYYWLDHTGWWKAIRVFMAGTYLK